MNVKRKERTEKLLTVIACKKTTLILLLMTLCSAYSIAQKANWAISGGTWTDDFVNRIITDKEGNIYSTGHIGGFGSSFGVTFNTWGYYLLKQDRNGVIKWIRYSAGNAYNATGHDIAVDSKGNVYVVGGFNYNMDLGDTTLSSGASGPYGMLFFIKYDSNGNRKWARVLGNDGDAGAGRLAVDKHDNVYLAGAYIFNINLGNGISLTGDHPYYWPYSDIFVSRWTSSGHPVWGQSFSTFNDDRPVRLQTSANGNVHLAARFEDTDLIAGKKHYTLAKTYSSYIASCDSTGNILKVSSTDQSVLDMAISKAGDFYVTGLMQTSNYYVSKINSNYTTDWIKVLNTGSFYVNPTIATGDSSVYMSATDYNSSLIDSLNVSSHPGLFVAKISSIGAVQWIKDYSTAPSDRVNTICTGVDKTLTLGGLYSELSFSFDGHAINNNSGNGDGDIFITQLRDTTVLKCPKKISKLTIDRVQICKGDSIQMKVNSGTSSYLVDWFLNDQRIATKMNFYAKQTGQYKYVRYPNTICADTSNQVQILVVDYPSKQINPKKAITCNSSDTIRVASNPNYTFHWYKDGQFLSGKTSSSLIASQSGTYFCLISNLGFCNTISDSSKLVAYQNPVFDIVATQINLSSVSYAVSNSVNISSYLWSVSGTQLMSTNANPTFTFPNGAFQVCVKASNPGCEVNKCTVQVITALEETGNDLQVFPNPFTEKLTIASSSNQEFSVDIFDLFGRAVERVTSVNSFEFKTGNWASGIYIARVATNGGSRTLKIIKD